MSEHETQLTGRFARGAADSGRIVGVTIRDLTVNRDPRGTLTELLRRDWADVYGDDHPFAQVYVSTTGPWVARDEDKWHVHRHQTDRFYCLAGRIVVAIADARPDSATRGKLLLVEMEASADAPAPLMVTIPPGTLHGFVVAADAPATLANFPNRLYDPADEGRVAFAEAAVTLPDGAAFAYELVRRHYRP